MASMFSRYLSGERFFCREERRGNLCAYASGVQIGQNYMNTVGPGPKALIVEKTRNQVDSLNDQVVILFRRRSTRAVTPTLTR